MKNSLTVILFIALFNTVFGKDVESRSFEWRNATVYFVITDRFCNGNSANDVNYGRIVDYGSERLNAATFHGGDFKGMMEKAREGYFKDLGVDVVWMTDVYEQIHGWIPGSGGAINDFPHYGYHGYYPLDYTQIDKNYGTIDEFRELVDCLHSQGIRVMLGANLNDPGYPTLLDAVQYGFAPTDNMTEADAAKYDSQWNYDSWSGNYHLWENWWTRKWIRTNDEYWNCNDPLTVTLYGMPDFKTEKEECVEIPAFLKNKWKREKSSNDAWVNPLARELRKDCDLNPSEYLIAWIASWVEAFGIDGFRCDIVQYVHLQRWKELSEACNAALNRWRANHPENPASKWDSPFYMTGDYDYASIDYLPEYAHAGFSSMVNFYFPKHGDLDGIVYTWQAYSDQITKYPEWHPFNYLNNSYNRDAEVDNMANCATTLLLSPGIAQIFYGDETGRKLSDAQYNVDKAQAFRSDMNWDDIDTCLLAHYRRLGQIRHEHPAIASGKQVIIDNHTCVRMTENDTVVIRVRPESERPINVSSYFPNGTIVTDLYTGKETVVRGGFASFDAYRGNVAILLPKRE